MRSFWLLMVLPLTFAIKNESNTIIADVQRGSYSSASLKFVALKKTMSDDEAAYIRDILSDVLENSNCDRYLKFVKALPWFLHRIVGYDTLIEKHEISNCLFTLDTDFRDLLAIRQGEPEVTRRPQYAIEEMKKKIVPRLRERIAVIADEIINGNFSSLVEYSKTHQRNFDVHSDAIVETVYEKSDESVPKILAFADKLTIIGQSGKVYLKLYNLLEKNKDVSFEGTVKIALKVKELTEMPNYGTTPTEIKLGLNAFKEKVPDSLKGIVWGYVCIKNEDFDGYLNDQPQYNFNKVVIGKRREFWQLESSGDFFKIRNKPSKKYLYVSGDDTAYNLSKRQVFAGWGNDRMSWQLVDFGWRAGRFLIKNSATNEYLNAGNAAEVSNSLLQNESNVEVFTCRRRNAFGNNAKWILNNCN